MANLPVDVTGRPGPWRLAASLSVDEIAADLTVSVNTVKTGVRSIDIQLAVTRRRTADESGLVAHAPIAVRQ